MPGGSLATTGHTRVPTATLRRLASESSPIAPDRRFLLPQTMSRPGMRDARSSQPSIAEVGSPEGSARPPGAEQSQHAIQYDTGRSAPAIIVPRRGRSEEISAAGPAEALSGETSAAAQQRTQATHVRDLLDGIDGVNQAIRRLGPQHRRDEIARFVDHLGARHRVARRATYRGDAFRK